MLRGSCFDEGVLDIRFDFNRCRWAVEMQPGSGAAEGVSLGSIAAEVAQIRHLLEVFYPFRADVALEALA